MVSSMSFCADSSLQTKPLCVCIPHLLAKQLFTSFLYCFASRVTDICTDP